MKAIPDDHFLKRLSRLLALLRGQLLSTFSVVDSHIVPDGNSCCWFVEALSAFSFSSFKHDIFLIYPLAVLVHLRPRYAYILGRRGQVRSQGGYQPTAAKPALFIIAYFRRFYAPCLFMRKDSISLFS